MGTRKERREGTIGQRIAFRWSERGTPNEQLRVDIAQSVSQIQLLLLVIWLVLWFSLEAVVLYFWTQEPAEGNASVGYAIYSAFWAFFAFRIGKVLLWRLRGREVVVVDRRGISLAAAFGDRGLPDFFAHGAYRGIKRVEENPTQILRTFEQAFWSMGGETLQFEAGRRTMVFGKQLDHRDADALLRLLRPAADRLARNLESTPV
jgi:hypothetical protein